MVIQIAFGIVLGVIILAALAIVLIIISAFISSFIENNRVTTKKRYDFLDEEEDDYP